MKGFSRTISIFVFTFTFLITSAMAYAEPYDNIEPYASISRNTYQEFICIAGPNLGGYIPTSSEVYVKVQGTYEVDIAEDTIIKVSKDSVHASVTGFGDITSANPNFSIQITSKRANYTSQQAEFTVGFNLYVTYGGIDYKELCGHYTIKIVGSPNGGVAIGCEPSSRYVYPD